MVTVTFPDYYSYMLAASSVLHVLAKASPSDPLMDYLLTANKVMNEPAKAAKRGEGDEGLLAAMQEVLDGMR